MRGGGGTSSETLGAEARAQRGTSSETLGAEAQAQRTGGQGRRGTVVGTGAMLRQRIRGVIGAAAAVPGEEDVRGKTGATGPGQAGRTAGARTEGTELGRGGRKAGHPTYRSHVAEAEVAGLVPNYRRWRLLDHPSTIPRPQLSGISLPPRRRVMRRVVPIRS